MKVTTTARMVRSTQATRLVTGSLRSGAAARVNVQRNCSATASTFTRGKADGGNEKKRKKERKRRKKRDGDERREGAAGLSRRENPRNEERKKRVCAFSALLFSLHSIFVPFHSE